MQKYITSHRICTPLTPLTPLKSATGIESVTTLYVIQGRVFLPTAQAQANNQLVGLNNQIW